MPPLPQYNELERDLPLVLLPVRLETRFFAADATNVELRVRIFPAAAHVTTDRPGVNTAEQSETQAYWQTRHSTGDSSDQTKVAWTRLTGLFGDPRALWLQRTFTPTIAADGSLVFPSVPEEDPQSADILTSEAIALPTRFIVSGFEGNTLRFRVTGQPVPKTVTVGPHGPADAIRWQTEFATAETIGLAVRAKLPSAQAEALTRLLVFGLREGPDAATSQTALQTLFDRHSRDDGIALLQPGTATNNTPLARVKPLPSATGAVPSAGSDGARVASALGIDVALFAAVGGSAATSEPSVEAMHTALWPVTLGYFLEDVMSPLLSGPAILRGRDLFEKFVRPNGPFPVLAFGPQPYGVLPVSSVAFWRSAQSAPDALVKALAGMRPDWLAASNNAPRLGRGSDAGADLTAILSQSPMSVRWIARTLESVITAQRVFADLDAAKLQTTIDKLHDTRVAREMTPLGLSGSPVVLDFLFNESSFYVRAPLVAPVDTPRDSPLAANYIDAIAKASVDALKNEQIAGASPKTLLYMLLRHATLLAMARSINIFPGLADAAVNRMVFVESSNQTVWTGLTTPVAQLGNKSLSEAFASATLNPALTDFAQHRAALNVLAGLPVGALEQLAAGALDCCSHRLDAWTTALATERLGSMRTTVPSGLHLGAFAWLNAPPVPAALSTDSATAINDPLSEGFLHCPGLAHARTAAILRSGFISRQNEAAQASLTVDLSSDSVRGARWLIAAIRGGANLPALLGERIERWMAEAGIAAQVGAVCGQFPLNDGSGRTRIDGLLALDAWKTPPAGALGTVAQRLATLVDATSSLLFAEAVHETASGRPQSAQSSLSALDTGVAIPSDFEVVRTSTDSSTLTWRLILPLAADAVAAWTASWIGPVDHLQAIVAHEDGTTTAVTAPQLELASNDLLNFVQTGPDAPALVARCLTAAGPGAKTVTFSPELATALRTADALSRLLRSSKLLDDGDAGTTRALLPDFAAASRRKEWLHDLARVRPAVDALDALDFIARANQRDLGLRFYSGDNNLVLVSIGDAAPAGVVAGLLLDAWNDTTPGTNATTGVAFHYEAPRSRAPQAILIAVPPEPGAPWSVNLVETILSETAELAAMRMVSPSDVHGSFLPGIYLTDNLANDAISTNFFTVSAVNVFKDS